MFEMAIYFVLCYTATAIIIGVARKRVSTKSRRWGWLLLLLPILPYACVACQTALFGRVLLPATHEALRYDDDGQQISSYKVLYISPWAAQVYVILHEPVTDYDLSTMREYPLG